MTAPEMTDAALAAHSLAEAYVYLAASPCVQCGRGPVIGTDTRTLHDQNVRLDSTCSSCGFESSNAFLLDPQPTHDADETELNGANEPSRIIDVGQWMTLYQVIMDATESRTDKVFVRELKLHAAQCIAEALKFYDDPDSDLPPPEACFHESTRRRFRDAPQQFAKDRLTQLRAALPVPIRSSEARQPPASAWRRTIQAVTKHIVESRRTDRDA